MRVKQQVEKLMSLDARYRNSDKHLILKVWQENGLELTKAQRMVFWGVPSAESITRRRRELSGKYPASEKVMEHRYKHYKAYTNEFSKQNFIVKLFKRHGI